MVDIKRKIVIVSGAPGAGKSTLASPLGELLGFPLFSKDLIKETLADVLIGNSGDLTTSRRIGAAAMELMWSLSAKAPKAVLEANFRPYSEYERGKLLGLNATIVEVYCDCGLEEAARRFRERAATNDHHAVAHPLKELSPELLAEYDRPVGIGTVIVADTRRPVDLYCLVEKVLDALS